jgi:predicted dehydrogenase
MTFRVAIIGCGGIAGGYDIERFDPDHPMTHAGALSTHGGFSLVICVDPDRERAAQFASRWGISETAVDTAKLLERADDLDTVIICSPTSHHGADLDVALQMRPRLVVCEKPITLSYETSRYWVERFAGKGIPMLVNYTRRWAPDIVRLAMEIRSGGRGALRSISGVYNKGLMNNGSHMVDLIRMFVDGCEVIGVGNPVHDHFPDDPSVPFMLRSRDGVPIAVNTAHAADFALFELEFVTSTGTVRMEAGGTRLRERSVVDSEEFLGYRVLGSDRVASGEYRRAMSAMVDNQYRFLTTGQRLACDGGTALDTQRLCAAIKMAAWNTEGI